MKGRLQICYNIGAKELLSGNIGQGTPLLTPSASQQLAGTSKKCAFVSPDFCKCRQWDTSRLPGLEANRVYDYNPKDCIYLHTFKAAT